MNLVEKATAAGTKKSVKEKKLMFEHYFDTLTTRSSKYVVQNAITSHKHSIYTVNQTKISLTAQDTKRYILKDGVNTIAHGHYRIVHGDAE